MTKITRVTVRETEIEYRGRRLIVQLLPRTLCIWRKGNREMFFVPYDVILELGEKIAARRKM